MHKHFWTCEEDARLREFYSKIQHFDELDGLFPSRTNKAIRHRAFVLGLSTKVPYVAWSQAELDLIRANYSQMTVKSLAALIPGRTMAAIAQRASMLGCTRGMPGGRRRVKALRVPAEYRAPAPLPVSPAMRRLAEYDPVVARAVRMRELAG